MRYTQRVVPLLDADVGVGGAGALCVDAAAHAAKVVTQSTRLMPRT